MCNTMNELSTIAKQLYDLKQEKAIKENEVKALKNQIDQLKKETASYMKKRKKNQLAVGSYVILFTPYDRPYFDTKMFIESEEDGQELYNKYLKKNLLESITVKLAKA